MQPSPIQPPTPDELVLPSLELRRAVEIVCERDRLFQRIETEAGTLKVRCWSPGFASLVRIIVGQQLSAKAARAIFGRLSQCIELTPDQFLSCSEVMLRQAGLSQAKIATCQRLAAAILTEQLSLEAMQSTSTSGSIALLSDSHLVEQLTQIKGIGVWTAEVYLLFCLERLNSFPASDLAIQVGYQRLKLLDHRPTRQKLLSLVQPLEPYRGAVAHLIWHYYRSLSR